MTENMISLSRDSGRKVVCESLPITSPVCIEDEPERYATRFVALITEPGTVETFLWRHSLLESKGTLRLPNANLYPLRELVLPSEWRDVNLASPCVRGLRICVIGDNKPKQEVLIDGLRPNIKLAQSESVYLIHLVDRSGKEWVRRMFLDAKGFFGGLGRPERYHSLLEIESLNEDFRIEVNSFLSDS